MVSLMWRIIHRMLDFYRRVWQAFLAAFIASLVSAFVFFTDNRIAFIILLIFSVIFFTITLIGLYYDYRDARAKGKREYDRTHGKFDHNL